MTTMAEFTVEILYDGDNCSGSCQFLHTPGMWVHDMHEFCGMFGRELELDKNGDPLRCQGCKGLVEKECGVR